MLTLEILGVYVFPRSTKRGLIEACREQDSRECHKAFRAQRSAASLKRAACFFAYSACRSFPRSTKRGLIEADCAGDFISDSGVNFPRSTKRGLIEAGSSSCHVPSVNSSFRAQRSAASLKRRGLVDALIKLAAFRAQRSAASLKHTLALRCFGV